MAINEFQRQTCLRIENLLQTLPQVEANSFQEVIGKEETYLQIHIEGARYTLEVYLYEDEAGYFLDGRPCFPRKKWIIYEKPDFSSSKELLQAFLIDLREKLS